MRLIVNSLACHKAVDANVCQAIYTENGKYHAYYCLLSEGEINGRCEIKAVEGEHLRGKSNRDVTHLVLNSLAMTGLPTGLNKIFPKVRILMAEGCGLEEIRPSDFSAFENLEGIRFNNNKLKLLPDDLFNNVANLNEIEFQNNQLEYMSSRLLGHVPVHQWEIIDFRGNTKIDAFFSTIEDGGIQSVRELKALINSSCSSPLSSTLVTRTTSNFKKLRKSSQFSDFQIIVGSKEFPVHKCILAAQSSAFTLLLKNDEQVQASNKIEIKDCCEEAVEEFLRCLYSGEVRNNKENVLELYSLACIFDVKEIREAYEGLVIKNLIDENALKVLKLGNLYKSEKLIEAAFGRLEKCFPEAITSDVLKTEPERVEEIVNTVKLFKKSVKNYKKTIKKLTKK